MEIELYGNEMKHTIKNNARYKCDKLQNQI